MPGQHVFENHCSGNKTQQGSQNSRTPGQQALSNSFLYQTDPVQRSATAPLANSKLISRFFGSSVEKEVEDARVKAIKLMEEARSILERDDSEFISFVMKAFFNDDSSGKRKAWIRDLHKVLSAARAATFPRNLNWMESSAVAELDMSAYAEFARYVASMERINANDFLDSRTKDRELKEAKKNYADERKSQFLKVTKTQWTRNKAFGADHLAQTMIHEFSHAALDTQDFVYGDIRNDDLSQLYQLAQGTLAPAGGTKLFQSTLEQLKNGKGEAFDKKAEGGTLAYRNADSFAYATAYLAHSGAKGERQARFQSLRARAVT